jgi:glycosyltransferase 2 family protein
VPLGFQYHLRCYFTANFANVFTPANLGGDAYRFLVLRPHAKRTIHLIVALVQERFIGIAGYAVLYFVLLLWFAIIDGGDFSGGAVSFLLLAGVLAIALVFAWTLGVVPQIGRFLPLVRNRERFVELVDTLMLASRFGGMRRTVVLLGLSLLGGIIWTMVPLIVARSLGTQVSYGTLGMIVIFVEFIRIVPITVQGIGVREGLFAYCFSLLHLPPEKGFLIGTVSYLALSLGLLVVGIISRLLPEKPRPNQVL